MQKTLSMTFATAAIVLASAGAGPATAAGLLDGSVTVTNNGPSLSDVALGPLTGTTISGVNLNGFSFHFTDTTASFTNSYGPDFYTYVAPPGVNDFIMRFTGVPAITGVTNAPSSQLIPVGLDFGRDWIAFNVSGLARYPGETTIFNVDFSSPAPEPAAWALTLAGFLAIGAALRSRRGRAGAGSACGQAIRPGGVGPLRA